MVFEKVRDILSTQFDIEADTITMNTNVTEDLCVDSLEAVDMLMSMEDEFNVQIPDEELETIHTVGDIVSYIEERL